MCLIFCTTVQMVIKRIVCKFYANRTIRKKVMSGNISRTRKSKYHALLITTFRLFKRPRVSGPSQPPDAVQGG